MLLSRGYLIKISPDIPLQSVLRSSSQQAEEINRVADYFYLAAAFILSVVAASTSYVLSRFGENKTETPPKSLSRKWETFMIGIPTPLVVVFLYLNIRTINSVEPDWHGHNPDAVITAHQWWWQAHNGPGRKFVSHEAACILNTGNQEAHIELTIYFSDKDPVGP